MFCARCDQPILPGEAYETRPIISPTGPGSDVVLHKELCPQPPTQTAPVEPRRRIRGY
jgi:hypothetical protein